MTARYLVGIDLGTTNSALAYLDTAELPRRLRDFPIPQLVGPGDVAARPTLPSLHHHLGEHELPRQASRLPWTPKDAEPPDYVVGELARTQAQLVPGRSVMSAKSWLCHPRVDRLQDILPWGARTLSADPQWRYLNVRRLFCMVEEAIADGTQWIVFEPNDKPLWNMIKRDVTAFLLGLWRDGALAGSKPEEAFFVKCDSETNPPDVVDAGRVVAWVGLAPVKPAEFIVFQVSQFSGGTTTEELNNA